MCPFFQQDVREISRQRLSDGNIGNVTTGDGERAVRTEEACELPLQQLIKVMIAGSNAGCSDIDSVAARALKKRFQDGGVTRKPIVIATAEEGEAPVANRNACSVDSSEVRCEHSF